MEAFNNFLNDENDENLLNTLYEVDGHAKAWIGGKDKSIWLRYFHGATEATTIQDIYTDLRDSNRNYMLENMKLCVDSGEIEVYYS